MGPHVFYLVCAAMVTHLTPTRPLSRTLYQVPRERKALEVSADSKEGGEVCDEYLPMTPA